MFYSMVGSHEGLKEWTFHATMAVVYMAIGTLFTLILPATMITSEKESRAWHLLLATTLTDLQIVFGKIIGSLRRCILPWCYLFGHIIIFTIFGIIHPLGLLLMLMIVIGMIMLLTGSGIYFSTVFKKTTTAVTMNILFAAIIWLGIFVILSLFNGIQSEFFSKLYFYSIPFVQAVDSMDLTANGIGSLKNAGEFSRQSFGFSSSPIVVTMYFLCTAAVNTAIGLMFIWRSKKRFRKKIF